MTASSHVSTGPGFHGVSKHLYKQAIPVRLWVQRDHHRHSVSLAFMQVGITSTGLVFRPIEIHLFNSIPG